MSSGVGAQRGRRDSGDSMKALQSIIRPTARKLVAMTVAAVVAATAVGTVGGALAGCGGSDTRDVQAPPSQQKSNRPVTASGAGAGSGSQAAQGASAAMGASSIAQMRQDLVAGQQQIDRTLASLRKLTDPSTTDLRGAYDEYSNNLARMNDHSEKVSREANAMRNDRNAYFAQWEAKLTEIENPTIRASAEQRRNKLRQSHERITTLSGEARDAYDPFMRDLQDVRKFLGGDLSRQSVSMLGDVQRKAAASGATVNQKIAAIVAELDAIDAGAR
jgi:hypothetical protein